MLVVNFIGGPCAGKTTNALGLAYLLKRDYVACTLALEYMGNMIHSAREDLLSDQNFIFGQQNHSLEMLRGRGYDIVVTDAPLINSAYYAGEGYSDAFREHVWQTFGRYDNFNVFLERNHPYSQTGRIHTEVEADRAALSIRRMVEDRGLPLMVMRAGDDVPQTVREALKQLRPDIWARAEAGKKRQAAARP